MKKKTNCLICESGGGPLGHLEDIVQRLEWLDDKPWQLFSAIHRASHLVKVTDEQELLKMTNLGSENAHFLIQGPEDLRTAIEDAFQRGRESMVESPKGEK